MSLEYFVLFELVYCAVIPVRIGCGKLDRIESRALGEPYSSSGQLWDDGEFLYRNLYINKYKVIRTH